MASTTRLRFAFLFTACIGVSLAGCNDGTTSGNTASSGSSTTTSIGSKTVSRISGNPASSVVVGSAYRFLPTAAAVGDATLTFSIQNQPKWTSFDSTTGLLTGTPRARDVSTFKQIVIAVSDGATTASLTAFSISVTPATAADSVSISGSPAVSVVAGAAYSFQPTAKSAGGGTLTFAVGNLPTWAKFDSSTGSITGTPSSSDVGKSSQIVISASNGKESADLAAFVITVTQGTALTADLSWVAATTTANGNLPNLAGYRVYYGRSASSLSHVVDIYDAAATSYKLADLTAGTWYFAVTAYNTAKVESTLSAVVPVTL